MKIGNALISARYMWPEFVTRGEFVFFDWCAPDTIDLDAWHDRVELESFVNHTHILDLFEHGAGLEDEPFWNSMHPDFIAAEAFGKLWIQAIACKLSKDHPTKHFRVYYTGDDNPIVRFHQVYSDEPNYIDLDENNRHRTSSQVQVIDVHPTST